MSDEIKKLETVDSNQSAEARDGKKPWMDHWLVQALMITLYFKLFGVLGGLCGLGSFYYFKKTQSTGIAIIISVVVSILVWATAFALIKSNY